MSIATAITAAQAKVAAAYSKCNDKGATMPTAADQNLSHLANTIDSIPTGGGCTTVDPDADVRFFDYDGTLLYTYSAADFANLTELPPNPSHQGLTAQGWNWSLADAKAYVASYGFLDIGQNYVTDDAKTRLHITIEGARLDTTLYFAQTVANGVTINWGDGSASETVAGTGNKTASHTYANAGNYVISLEVTSGTLNFGHNSASISIIGNGAGAYANSLRAVEIGTGVSVLRYGSFTYCSSLATVTIPTNITSVEGYAFYYCNSLKMTVIPSGVTSLGLRAFYYCAALTSIAAPKNLATIGQYCFIQCSALRSICLPAVTLIDTSALYSCFALERLSAPAVTSINGNAFYQNYCLKRIAGLSLVTTVGDYAFSYDNTLASFNLPALAGTIGQQTFRGLVALTSFTIPSGVTAISGYAFYGCSGMKEFHIKPTTPPTIAATTAFQGVPSDCIFYVPSASLAAYQSATNWSAYQSQMVGE